MEGGEVKGGFHPRKDLEPKKTFNVQCPIGNRKWALGNGAGSWRGKITRKRSMNLQKFDYDYDYDYDYDHDHEHGKTSAFPRGARFLIHEGLPE